MSLPVNDDGYCLTLRIVNNCNCISLQKFDGLRANGQCCNYQRFDFAHS